MQLKFNLHSDFKVELNLKIKTNRKTNSFHLLSGGVCCEVYNGPHFGWVVDLLVFLRQFSIVAGHAETFVQQLCHS